MEKKISASLIIATYNWPKALELVLLSVKKQSILPNEVIIADDGSNNKTKALVTLFQKTFPVPLIHVWHEDTGFRLSEIRNKAIAKSSSEYIIQIDGDVILHRHFIKHHLKMSKKNVFISGSRVWLNEETSKNALENKKIRFNYFSKGISNRLNALYIPFLIPIFSFYNKNLMKVRGCNMSFWKKDLIAINGYNEDMTGWGREDSEISARLKNSNIQKRHIKLGAIQYHLYHKLSSRNELNINHNILEETIDKNKMKCENGLDKYL